MSKHHFESSGPKAHRAPKASQPKRHRAPYSSLSSRIQAAGPVFQRLMGLRRASAMAKDGWCDAKDAKVNVKELSAQLDLAEREWALIRATLRSGLGNRPIHMRLVANFSLTATVTSGVVNTLTMGGGPRFLVSDSTEYSTLSALFDEVKVNSGDVEFVYVNPIQAPAGVESLPRMAYDPSSIGTVAASTAAVATVAQNKPFPPLVGILATGSLASDRVHAFHFEVPPGVQTANNGGNTTAGSQWMDAAAPQNNGCLMFYHVGNTITAIQVGAGQTFYNAEFRCRQ